MATKVKTRTPSNSVPPTLQKLFIASCVLTFGMQIAQSVYFTILQFSSSTNFNVFINYYVGLAIMLLVLALLYATKRHRALNLKNMFDVSVLASSIVFLGVGLSWLTMFVPMPYGNATSSFSYFVVAYQLMPLLVTLPLVVIVIRRLRAQNQW